jgi:hypothetical protein
VGNTAYPSVTFCTVFHFSKKFNIINEDGKEFMKLLLEKVLGISRPWFIDELKFDVKSSCPVFTGDALPSCVK